MAGPVTIRGARHGFGCFRWAVASLAGQGNNTSPLKISIRFPSVLRGFPARPLGISVGLNESAWGLGGGDFAIFYENLMKILERWVNKSLAIFMKIKLKSVGLGKESLADFIGVRSEFLVVSWGETWYPQGLGKESLAIFMKLQ